MSIKEFHQSCQKLDGGQDDTLSEYVVQTNVVHQLARFDAPAHIAVGLKGIGKSSAFRYLTDFDPTADVVVAIAPKTHSSGIPDRRLNFAACMKQFEQDIVIEALRAVDTKSTELKAKGVDSGLLKKAAGQVRSYKEALSKAAGRLRGGGVSILGCGFTVTRGDAPTLMGLATAKDLSDPKSVLADLCNRGLKIRIVVDDPELVFSDSQDLDPHLVGGFLLAGLAVSREVPNFKVIAFVKTHVYHPVRDAIEDFSKYPDHQSRLGWTVPELEQVVGRRLKWANTSWRALFSAKDEKGAFAQAAKMAQEIRNGPRDLLRWLDLSLQKSPHGAITSDHLTASKRQMSKDSLKEMESAHAATYPKVGAVVRAVFGSSTDKQFTRATLHQHIAKLLVGDERLKALSTLTWMQRQSSDTLADVFLEVGALGIRGRSNTILPYSPQYDQDAFEEASAVFLVPVFREAVTVNAET
jgi:hypothetical protein